MVRASVSLPVIRPSSFSNCPSFIHWYVVIAPSLNVISQKNVAFLPIVTLWFEIVAITGGPTAIQKRVGLLLYVTTTSRIIANTLLHQNIYCHYIFHYIGEMWPSRSITVHYPLCACMLTSLHTADQHNHKTQNSRVHSQWLHLCTYAKLLCII